MSSHEAPAILDRPARPGLLVVAFLMAMAPGCADEWGPERFPTTRIEGTIRVAGRPLSSGWVEFVPIEGTRGDLRSAPIGKDGAFAADKVPVGRVAVRLPVVYGPTIPTSLGPVDLATFRSFQTPIRRITEAGRTRFDLDLAVEAEAHQRRRLEMSRLMNDPKG